MPPTNLLESCSEVEADPAAEIRQLKADINKVKRAAIELACAVAKLDEETELASKSVAALVST